MKRILEAVLLLIGLTVTAHGQVNVALNKPALQSSTYAAGGAASRAVDGNRDGTWGGASITHTNNDAQAWWQVDLGAISSVNDVRLWTRTECCADRLSNFYVLVSNVPFHSTSLTETRNQPGVSSYYFAGQAARPTAIAIGRTGRYVRVQLAGTNYLSLAELEVFGTPTGESRANVALASRGAIAVASSTHSTGFNERFIIDGRRSGSQWGVDGGWNDFTAGSWPDWVEVQFNGTKLIDQVNVFSVQDNVWGPGEPFEGQTFTQYGLVDFEVQYWTGTSWTNVPNGAVSGNNLVWRNITFGPVETNRIRVWVTLARDTWTRIAEVEALEAEWSAFAVNWETYGTQVQTSCAKPPKGETLHCPVRVEDLLKEINASMLNEGKAEDGMLLREVLASGAGGAGRWKRCVNPTFANWHSAAGSHNLPVLAAAIGLFREPRASMPKPSDLSPMNITYAEWWARFLEYQVGAREPITDGLGCTDANNNQLNYSALRHFKGKEQFSNIYDPHTTTTVIAARYWATKNRAVPDLAPVAARITAAAERYLRAQWLVNGMTAGTCGPTCWARKYVHPTVPILTGRFVNATYRNADLPWNFVSGTGKHNGHFLALAGARSNSATWVEGSRAALFDRAIGYSASPSNEWTMQKTLLDSMSGNWGAVSGGANRNLYGLTLADRNAFTSLIASGNIDYFVPNLDSWFQGISTIAPLRIIGWNAGGTQVRASVMGFNPNANTPSIFGVMFWPGTTNTATFLYPYSDIKTSNMPHREGYGRWEGNRMIAHNGGEHRSRATGLVLHPSLIAEMAMPSGTQLFHLVLRRRDDGDGRYCFSRTDGPCIVLKELYPATEVTGMGDPAPVE
jgi:hypothetical protein